MTRSASPNLIHDPVMLREMVAAMAPAANETYIDGTFGAGGYSTALLSAAPCRIIAFDRDPDARARYDALPAEIRVRCSFVDDAFSQLEPRLHDLGIDQVDGIVLDLGVSSPQLDDATRGFSFRADGPLDMRMDPRRGESAADVVNTRSEEDLANIIYTYGEDRKSRVIARAIVQARQDKPITTTGELAEIVKRVIHISPKDPSHPATRTFQALRIFVNGELDELRDALVAALAVLREGGRLVVVTFHSLEDRIVKQFFQTYSGRTPGPSRYLPDVAVRPALLSLPQAKALSPKDDEIARNPRSRSAHLRIAIRTDAPLWPSYKEFATC